MNEYWKTEGKVHRGKQTWRIRETSRAFLLCFKDVCVCARISKPYAKWYQHSLNIFLVMLRDVETVPCQIVSTFREQQNKDVETKEVLNGLDIGSR